MQTHKGANQHPRQPRIAIIGAGFSGLCAAIQLRKIGLDSITILEKSDRVGGTWRDNSYPGAACDVASFAYCFSFEQKTDWSRKWSPQAEILEYMEHCADKYDLRRHIRFSTEVESARFDEAAGVWWVRTRGGEQIEAEVLISGTGQLNRPYVPKIEGLDDFAGKKFHSARWDHDYDLTGKRLCVIGNAASAIQFIPQIAPKVAHLDVFQRSPNWMIPRGDRAYADWEKRLFTAVPLLARIYRWMIWTGHELMWPIFRRNRFFVTRMQRLAERDMRERVVDPKLQAVLLPDYPLGGKRLLISDDYYEALNRDNVDLVTTPIERVVANGVVTADGRLHEADALILATGFDSTSFLAPMKIEGLGGQSLRDAWHGEAQAYLGMTVAGFPNFFMMYGPNTNLGHNSIIFMIECQTRYIVECVRAIADCGIKYLDLRADVQEAYNRQLQAELDRTAWAATGKSWYKTDSGRITNNWSGTTTRYWLRTRRVDFGAYRQVLVGEQPQAAEGKAAA